MCFSRAQTLAKSGCGNTEEGFLRNSTTSLMVVNWSMFGLLAHTGGGN
jgi:hypothetical protein